jgi:Ig-like domain CHU_C associated/Secretion system C-terminal sorting domain
LSYLIFNTKTTTMKKIYKVYFTSFLVVQFLIAFTATAQTFSVAGCSGTLGSSTYGPMYSVATASATNRTAVIYPASQLTTIANQLLTNIYFNRITASGTMAGTPNFKIYLKEVSNTDWGSAALTWDVTGATLVYDDNPATIVGSTAGWKNFPLTSSFVYSGSQNLAVFFQYSNATTSTAITWVYEYTSPCVVTTNSNTTKYSNVTTGVLPTSLGSSDYRRPYIGFDYTSPVACTAPPTPGAATSNATGAICSGTAVSLNLTGNSTGSGLSYQWQSSSTLAGTYTNIGTSSINSSLTVNPTTNTYYRCAVTCSGNTQNSTPVLVSIASLFAGGNYTINSAAAASSTNFQSFTAATNAIKCGVTGAINFTVAPNSGPYNEQVVLPQIAGASATNRITFMCNGVTLNYAPTDANNRSAFLLNGADFVTLDSLNIDMSAGSTAGWGVSLTGKADSNIIRKCTINIGNLTATTVNFMGIALNGSLTGTAVSADNGNGNEFSNNNITGGYYGIYLYGNSTDAAQNANNKAIGNTVKDSYNYAIYSAYTKGFVVSGNDVFRPSRAVSTTAAGIFLQTGTVGALAEKNKIHNMFDAMTTNTSTSYGIYVGADATTTEPNRIINNLVYNMGGNGIVYGIYNVGGDNMQVYHNTISLDDNVATTGATYGIYQTTAAIGIDVKNNLINISRTGTGIKRGLHYNTATSNITSNNNVLYLSPSLAGTDNNMVQYGTTNYIDLAAWQASNSNAFDQQSVTTDPTFLNAASADYTPSASTANNTGTPVGVLTDIKNATRSTTSPDAGAYEFSTLTVGLNYGAEALVTPAASATGCFTNSEVVKVRIRNNRTTTHNYVTNPVTVTVNVTGALTQTLTFVLNTGTLASDATQDVTFATPINMSVAGTYNFAAYTTLAGDVNTGNDAMLPVTRTKNNLDGGTASISSATICAVGGTLPTLNASNHTGYGGLVWQESNTTGTGFTSISGATIVPYTITTSITQTKYYKLAVTCGANTNFSNELVLAYVNPTVTSTTPATRCGTGTVTLAATGSTGASIKWYANLSGGIALATSNSYLTPSLTTTTTYYAAATTAGGSENLPTPTVGTSPFWTANIGWGLRFTVNNSVTINSVKMYPYNTTAGAASIQVKITDLADAVLYSGTVFNFTVGTTAAEQIVPVGITVPPGDYKMVMTSTGINNLIRESSGLSFPYTAPSNAVTITAGANGVGTAQTTAAYYWFYAWNVSAGCESARTAVTATIDNSPTCTPTPVTLLSFKGDRVGAINKLEWITATEQNNAGFSLQRSVDGVNFSQLSYVNSKATGGNSNSQLSYTYDDVKPLQGNNYYRLQQKDRDGKTSYSQIVWLKGARVSTLTMSNVYPNPTVQSLNMILSSPAAEQVRIVVSDATGKIVWQQSKQVAQGDNNVQINVQALATGSYVVKAICNTGCETAVHKFVKQ